MSKVRLKRSGVVTLVGQRVAAGMAQHVRVYLEGQLGVPARALDHAGKSLPWKRGHCMPVTRVPSNASGLQ